MDLDLSGKLTSTLVKDTKYGRFVFPVFDLSDITSQSDEYYYITDNNSFLAGNNVSCNVLATKMGSAVGGSGNTLFTLRNEAAEWIFSEEAHIYWWCKHANLAWQFDYTYADQDVGYTNLGLVGTYNDNFLFFTYAIIKFADVMCMRYICNTGRAYTRYGDCAASECAPGVFGSIVAENMQVDMQSRFRVTSTDRVITEWLLAPDDTDPFAPGGTTGDDETDPEGGDGNFDNAEVTIDPPALPGLSAITSGFIAVYNPTFAQLQNLGDYLWSDLFSLDTFKKLFSDPMQAILGLSLVPVQPSTADGYVVIGNINTGISMPRCMSQFVTVDCGTVTLPEYWGGYLDYSPYTKVEIYLPYIGVRPLDTDEVMGKTLHVVYHVDILSGSCVCFIQCDNTIRYHYVGQCGASIPITANDWTRVVNGAVSIATALGVGVATLGAGAAAAGGVTAASMAGTGALVGGIASQVLASKPRVEHSGSLAGMGGLLGVQVPYIMLVRPRQAVPEGQNSFTGYPSFIRRTLSTVTGYTQVTGVHLVGLTCTDEEKKEIQALLEGGVIL